MKPSSPIDLKKKPKLSELHACCDYIELLCLIHPDREVSRADVLDRFRDELDIDLSPILEMDEADRSILDAPPPIKDDKYEQYAADWFAQLLLRYHKMGDFYPFTVSEDGRVLSRSENPTARHRFYIFLLLSSSIRYVMPWKPALTTCFERVSQEVLRNCLPEMAEVHIFGTSERKEGRYSGNKWQKLHILAQDLRVKVRITEDKLPAKDSGDGGLDIVGWIPTGDEIDGLIYFFGQCACTEDWVKKQHSSSYDTWSGMLYLSLQHYNVIFIPFFFRDNTGNWWKPQDIHSTIVMDRLRIILLINDDYQVILNHPVNNHISTVISYVESLV